MAAFDKVMDYALPSLSGIEISQSFFGWATHVLLRCPGIRTLHVKDKQQHNAVNVSGGSNLVQVLHWISLLEVETISFMHSKFLPGWVPVTAADVHLLVARCPKLRRLELPVTSMASNELNRLDAYLRAASSAKKATREWMCLNDLYAALTRGANGCEL